MSPEKWTFLVPFKDSRFAKSRLDVEQPLRRELALAMLYDTVDALLSGPDVQRVLVVCGGSEDVAELRARPEVEIVIEPCPDLNGAIRHGETIARATDSAVRLAVCPADLPALDPGELARVLTVCGAHARCVVPDRDGSGTTLLTSAGAVALNPAFGPGSLAAHVASGAELLQLPHRSTLRHDVDYLDDLHGVRQRAPLSRTAQLWTSARVAP